ncbi:sulfotransferase family protein [Coraliomargarita akajimensis]|uniref:Sulfotransferase n=1 Tax=Coraliomargarita akajimensis (strain DSM 45221 / IAM 15411 / JCM 23193 / KCTC 12865 / 04OKA010-24) TaxID=583355 RepID=D5EML7_CORAD|nr:sulfotransferase [Coraliomargarita akajimensis]ADE53423.1 sulfotransferase [Coraliomargarita akajimensis DSM 45221]
MKVNFIIIGAMKSGTTTVARMLEQHPNVILCDRKEPDFFSQSPDWRAELPKYEALYQQRDGVLYGEASTSYTFYPHRNLSVWEDIYEYNPEMKLIYIVRDPLSRTISQYVHMYERGYLQEDIETALRNRPEIINYSRYHTQVKPYLERFGPDQVLLLDFDDLKRDPEALFKEVSSFLGLDFEQLPDCASFRANEHTEGGGRVNYKLDGVVNQPPAWGLRLWRCLPKKFRQNLFRVLSGQKRNALAEKPVLSVDAQRVILRLLDDEITQYEQLLGKDLSHWRQLKA